MQENNMIEEKIEVKPKKRSVGRKILIAFLLFLFLILVLGFWGYREISSMSKPMDLGVEYTFEDYNDLITNIGIDVDSDKLCLDCPALSYQSPHEVDLVVTNEQAAAAFDIVNEKLTFGSVRDTQVRFTENHGELSTVFTYNGRDYPVYISGDIAKNTDKTISGEIFEIKVGSLKLPNSAKNFVEKSLVDLANERLGMMDETLRIDEVNITNEGLDFEGLVPTKAN